MARKNIHYDPVHAAYQNSNQMVIDSTGMPYQPNVNPTYAYGEMESSDEADQTYTQEAPNNGPNNGPNPRTRRGKRKETRIEYHQRQIQNLQKRLADQAEELSDAKKLLQEKDLEKEKEINAITKHNADVEKLKERLARKTEKVKKQKAVLGRQKEAMSVVNAGLAMMKNKDDSDDIMEIKKERF